KRKRRAATATPRLVAGAVDPLGGPAERFDVGQGADVDRHHLRTVRPDPAGVGLHPAGLAEAVPDVVLVEQVLGLRPLGLQAERLRLHEAEHEALAIAVAAIALDQPVEAHVDLIGHRAAMARAGVGLNVAHPRISLIPSLGSLLLPPCPCREGERTGNYASSCISTPGAAFRAPRRAAS